MEEFTYHNIFDTKGIEYLVIIGFFAILIPFWILLNRQARINREIRKSLGHLTAAMLRVPHGLYFSKAHTWTFLERSGTAKVGLDDLLLHLTGEVQINRLKFPGDRIVKGEALAEITNGGRTLKVLSPISGDVVEANEAISKEPAILNDDPYGKGWIYRIRPAGWVADTQSFYLADEATRWSESELEKFREFLGAAAAKYSNIPEGIVLQDGGELRDQPLAELPADAWREFQQTFIRMD